MNDVDILREMLILLYAFDPKNIVTLKNHQATRAAILQSIEQHLLAPAAKGDVVFYYFAGHGSQVPNAASDEADRLDESIVPADSRHGAADIRDKELRALFNRILDRGAQLTLLLDHCHSGSGFRGLPSGARPRAIAPAQEIRDATPYGPRPDERGALVLASTQDPDAAWERRGEDGLMHGAFSWAWIRAMRDAAAGEPAEETFLRAHARLRAETPYQAPAMLGPAAARLRPFLGMRMDRRNDRAIVAVERVDTDGTIVLQGGWANGLSMDTELSVVGDPTNATRLRITKILGLGRSVAQMNDERASRQGIRSGALLEVVRWAAPPGRPMRVWLPRTARSAEKLAAFARQLANRSNARWLADPLETEPTHVLRGRANGWELLDYRGNLTVLNDESVMASLAGLATRSALFVQFPIPLSAIRAIGSGAGIVFVDDPKDADYILAGRYNNRRLEYAWMQPNQQRHNSGLPQRTAWTSGESPVRLRADLLKLRRIHAWYSLQSPPGLRAPYRLTLRNEKTKENVRDGSVDGGKTYSVVLRASQQLPAYVTPRYYYAFVIDSHGRSYLTFPASGSVENRFPLADPAPAEIPLGEASAFKVKPPYGMDTYFLLSTDEPLPNPSILAWDGVRAPTWTKPLIPLEELLLLTITGERAPRALTTNRWSIERVVFESIPPGRR